LKVFSCVLPAHSSAWTAGLPLILTPFHSHTARMAFRMSKRRVYLALAALVVIVGAFVYPRYFNWWDNKNCSESGGTWVEAQGECVEPRGTDIPNTEKSRHSAGDSRSE
jgi:hypothetical protein